MSRTVTAVQIKDWAYEVGFDLVGIAPVEPIPHADHFRAGIERGYHGSMRYLERHLEKRIDPRLLMPGARSVICTAMSYFTGPPQGPGTALCGRVARYAWGRDYHRVVRTKLERLAGWIRTTQTGAVQLRCLVDTAPLAEKAHAARAGLGWIGKNSLLINERFGSWLVLGEILTDLEFDYDRSVPDQCGLCRRCLAKCPTTALVEPYVLDARRCISYLTIEATQPPPADLMAKMNGRLFGCDCCQEACPFNEKPDTTTNPDFQPHLRRCEIDLCDILTMDDAEFQRLFGQSSLARAGLRHLQRLADICKNNATIGPVGA